MYECKAHRLEEDGVVRERLRVHAEEEHALREESYDIHIGA